jgi:hypothetical protein
VQRAIAEVEDAQIETRAHENNVQVDWRWPQDAYINAAMFQIQRHGGNLKPRVVSRTAGAMSGSEQLRVGYDKSGSVALLFAVQSPSGAIFLAKETAGSAPFVTPPRPAPVTPVATSTARPLISVTSDVTPVVADEVEVAAPSRRRRRGRRIALVLILLIAMAVAAFQVRGIFRESKEPAGNGGRTDPAVTEPIESPAGNPQSEAPR